jgi:hypothetical protein
VTFLQKNHKVLHNIAKLDPNGVGQGTYSTMAGFNA